MEVSVSALCVFFPLVFLLLLLPAIVSFVWVFCIPFFGGDAFNFVLILRWLEISEQMISDGESLLILSTKWEMPYAQIWFLCFFSRGNWHWKQIFPTQILISWGKKKYIFHQNMSDTGLCQADLQGVLKRQGKKFSRKRMMANREIFGSVLQFCLTAEQLFLGWKMGANFTR